jgi:Tfp pilus assembly protein PilE
MNPGTATGGKMKLRHQQQGMTLIGLVLVFVIIGFFALIFMRLLPVYMEDASISSAMQTVARDLPPNASFNEIKKALGKNFDINNVKAVQTTDFVLVDEGGSKVLSVDYEARAPFVSNISFVVEFGHEVTLGAPDL